MGIIDQGLNLLSISKTTTYTRQKGVLHFGVHFFENYAESHGNYLSFAPISGRILKRGISWK